MKLIEHIRKKLSDNTATPKAVKGNVELFIDDQIPEEINISEFIKVVEKALPPHFFNHVNSIHIGNYDFLLKNNLKSYYKDGKIYLTADESSLMHLAYDLFHEVAHSLEGPFAELVYSDGALKKEFLNKRDTFERFLNVYFPETQKYSFKNTKYNKEFDELLHKRIGYDRLRHFSDGIFVSPYAATSLREYFATGLENYIEGDRENLYRQSPILYNKIKSLFNE